MLESASREVGGLDLIPLNLPLGCGPGSDPPQFAPWVWAWILSPSISPLGVGLDLILLNFPLGCGPGGGLLLRGPPFWGGLLLGGSPWQGGLLGALLGGGSPWQGGLLGALLLGGGPLGLGGASFLGAVSQHALRQTPPLWTESQTRVKT